MSAKLERISRQGRRWRQTSAQSLLVRRAQRAWLTASARRRFGQESSLDHMTSRVKDIGERPQPVTNTGLREYEAPPFRQRGRSKTLTEWCAPLDAIQVRSIGSRPAPPESHGGNDGAEGEVDREFRLKFVEPRASSYSRFWMRGAGLLHLSTPSLARRHASACACRPRAVPHFRPGHSRLISTAITFCAANRRGCRGRGHLAEPPALFRARLAESFQQPGSLAQFVDGSGCRSQLRRSIGICAFELDAQTSSHVDIAAWIVSLGSGRIMADPNFCLRMVEFNQRGGDGPGGVDCSRD